MVNAFGLVRSIHNRFLASFGSQKFLKFNLFLAVERHYFNLDIFYFMSKEYPLDDLCSEIIDRWKSSRTEVIQKGEQLKGKGL